MDAWPDSVVRRFAAVPPNPRENDLYGPWNKLLSHIFPPSSEFTVAPQSYLIPTSNGATSLALKYEVLHNDIPVLVVEIKPPGSLRLPSARKEADNLIRSRLRDLSVDCPLPKLHAVSAFGTKVAFYQQAKGYQMMPPGISPDANFVTDTAPLRWWDCDVLEDEGRRRFRALVTEIEEACKASGLESG
ncbi:hypothetical protein DFH06DRAFT_1141027 [Mycena polygramma]|nr:hypothetical protein DFH06DRAFT_1141027 [Mycena polygramma]